MAKQLNNLLLTVLAGLLLSACSIGRNANDSADYKEQENLYQKKIGPYTFSLKPFAPQRLMELNYGSELSTLTKEQADSILQEYNSYLCFVFELDIEGFSGDIADYEGTGIPHDFDQRADYYLFGMQHDFKMKGQQGLETPCTIYYYERLNEIAKTNRFIIGFKNPGTAQATLEYTNPYFKCGKINFSINNTHLALK